MRSPGLRSITVLFVVAALSLNALAQASGKKGVDLASLDKTCEPCEDFYKFANGGWLASKENQIPAAYPVWNKALVLNEKNQDQLKQILEAATRSARAPKGSNEQLTGDLFASCMDETKIEAAGAKPLAPLLARIERIKDRRELQAEVGRLHRQGIPVLFGMGGVPDFKNSSMVIAYMGQGGLSLPTRDYYTNDDERSKVLRAEFVKHVARMFELLGDEPTKAAAAAQTVLTIQTKLAMVSKTPVELRDPNASYNKHSLQQLKELTPDLAWDVYFAERGVPKIAELNVAQPAFFKELNSLMASVSLDDLKTLLRWHLVNANASRLSAKFDQEKFSFSRLLSGQTEQLPRVKRCVTLTDSYLGEALGQEYVRRAFTPQSKARMKEMVNNLLAAFRTRLLKLDWMSEDTRRQALVKLDAIVQKIGYPDKWESYDGLELSRDSLFDNMIRASVFHNDKNLRKIGKPVDRAEWAMSPPTVNAYYSALNNEIVFPAGMLQPPYFDPEADDALNYGAIGAVIGHEITHGFDDKGSQFDAQGNLRLWWTAEDRRNFEQRAECIAKQFSGYKVADDLFVNGQLTLGENIGDLGGLNVAFDAYVKSLEGKPRPTEIDGFTAEQRFFLGYAQSYAANMRPQFERLIVGSDPHSLGRFRVNGPFSNMPQFARAFGCKAGDRMVRPVSESCRIW
jgi:putative endopeptidase